MPAILITDAAPTAADQAALLTNTCVLTLPVPIPRMNSWKDLITWLKEHPELIALLVSMILAMLGAASTPQETPQK